MVFAFSLHLTSSSLDSNLIAQLSLNVGMLWFNPTLCGNTFLGQWIYILSPYSFFYHNIFSWYILPLSNGEDFLTLIQWFHNVKKFSKHIVQIYLTMLWCKKIPHHFNSFFNYFLPHDCLCSIPKLTKINIGSLTFQTHPYLQSHSVNLMSQFPFTQSTAFHSHDNKSQYYSQTSYSKKMV